MAYPPERRMIRLLAAAFTLACATAAADTPPQAALCTACHGTTGVPVNAAIPVIAGQPLGYLYLELRDYKRGDRASAVMQSVARTLDKPAMMALAQYFSAQPAPKLKQPPAPDDVARRVLTINGSAGCVGCHGPGFAGDSAVPRLAGQSTAYLQATMLAFKSGARANNPWMSALLKTYPDDDIAAMARYLGGL
jgi:cytochrome c553